jgi:hypothetical protein
MYHDHPQGKCTAAECRYLHKTYAVNAPVCRAFLHSFCPRGAACPALHLTAKMARDRARLLTVPAGGSSGGRAQRKRRLSEEGSGAASGADAPASIGGGAEAAPPSPVEPVLFCGVALRAPKRRRGGFRYFNADPDEDTAAPGPTEADSRDAVSAGGRARGAVRVGQSRPRGGLAGPAGSGGSASLPDRGPPLGTEEAGKVGEPRVGDCDNGDGSIGGDGGVDDCSARMLPGGMMLFL